LSKILKALYLWIEKCISGTLQRIDKVSLHQRQLENQKGKAMEFRLCISITKVCAEVGSFGTKEVRVQSREEDSEDLFSTKRERRKMTSPL
jgi:hypothetical protein